MLIQMVPSRNETRTGASSSPGTIRYLHMKLQKPGGPWAGNFWVSRGFFPIMENIPNLTSPSWTLNLSDFALARGRDRGAASHPCPTPQLHFGLC